MITIRNINMIRTTTIIITIIIPLLTTIIIITTIITKLLTTTTTIIITINIIAGFPHNPYNGVICNDVVAASGVFTTKELWKFAKCEFN